MQFDFANNEGKYSVIKEVKQARSYARWWSLEVYRLISLPPAPCHEDDDEDNEDDDVVDYDDDNGDDDDDRHDDAFKKIL